MNFKVTGSCAVQEITGLRGHSEARYAMQDFCRQNLKSRVMFGGAIGAIDTLYSFYLFTAANYDKPYGTNFATFIKDHNLGVVWGSEKVVNTAFHPDHSNQVWIWTPDVPALRAWWDANKGKVTEENL